MKLDRTGSSSAVHESDTCETRCGSYSGRMEQPHTKDCNEAQLLSALTAALAEADRCDAVIAAHVAAAISRYHDLYPRAH